MKHALPMLLSLALSLCLLFPAMADVNPEEYSGPAWPMAVSLKHLQNAQLEVISPAIPADHTYKPNQLITVRARRNNEQGENTNGGVYLASGGNLQLNETCANAYMMMMQAAEADQITIYLRQGYRSYTDQKKRYERAEKSGNTQGVSKPGESDYQTGLAITVVGVDYRAATLDEAYLATPEAQWLAENAATYGFVLRTPQGKESITGEPYEPWHYRYVGIGVAAYMQNNNLTIEQLSDEIINAYHKFTAEGGDVRLAASVSYPDGAVELKTTGPDGDTEIVLFHD